VPKCANGHEGELKLSCSQCGAPVLFDSACRDLCTFPGVSLQWGEIAVVSAGLPAAKAPGALTFSISLGDETEMKADSLTLKKLRGGTWLDYYRAYVKTVVKWLRLVGYGLAHSRVLVADTTNPVSVLAMASPSVDEGTLVFGTMAGPASAPIRRNTSYVAMQVANRKKLPFLMAGEEYVEEVACFVEDEGLLVGPKAMERLVLFSLTFVGDLLDFVRKDIKLGVNYHVFSSLMAASAEVYRSVEDALEAQREMTSTDMRPKDVQMAYLLAASGKELRKDLEAAFEKRCREYPSLVNSDVRFRDSGSHYGFYDIFTLYGVKEVPSLEGIRRGYDIVVGRASDLRAEEIL
jgi:hypothetical protein